MEIIMAQQTTKKAVITLHGIRTRGEWQKRLVPLLAMNDFIPVPLDYGYFSVFHLLTPSARDAKLRWLRAEIDRVRLETGDSKPSIIAHSFGSYLVGKLIRDFPGQYFDKVILAGSILPESFPWTKILNSGRVQWVLNEYGALDIWPRICAKVVSDAGMAGTVGFTDKSPYLQQHSYAGFKHSDYMDDGHSQRMWLPILQQSRRPFIEWLNERMTSIAQVLRIGSKQINSMVMLRDCFGQLTYDRGLSSRVIDERFTIDLNRHYDDDSPQGAAVLCATKGEFFQLTTDATPFDSSVIPLSSSTKHLLLIPLYTNSTDIGGVLALSLIDGALPLLDAEVEQVANQLAKSTLSL